MSWMPKRIYNLQLHTVPSSSEQFLLPWTLYAQQWNQQVPAALLQLPEFLHHLWVLHLGASSLNSTKSNRISFKLSDCECAIHLKYWTKQIRKVPSKICLPPFQQNLNHCTFSPTHLSFVSHQLCILTHHLWFHNPEASNEQPSRQQQIQEVWLYYFAIIIL